MSRSAADVLVGQYKAKDRLTCRGAKFVMI